MDEVAEGGLYGRWGLLPVRYRYMLMAALALVLALAAGASGVRWSTPAWVIATAIGAFLLIYAFPSVWRYMFYLGLIYVLLVVGMAPTLFHVAEAPFFLGFAFIMHILALLVAYNLVKDVVMQRRAYHAEAIAQGKEAPYVPVGLWLLALVAFILVTDLSMWGFTVWALEGAALTGYVVAEVVLIGLLLYLLDVPERAYGGKGADFVPRVSLAEITQETRRVAKRVVSRPKRVTKAKRVVKASEASLRPKVLEGEVLACPACGSDLAMDVRRCPECYRGNEFAWCPVSEHYIIPCPACGKPTVYGEERCSSCGHRLDIRYKCPNCLKTNPLQRWERA